MTDPMPAEASRPDDASVWGPPARPVPPAIPDYLAQPLEPVELPAVPDEPELDWLPTPAAPATVVAPTSTPPAPQPVAPPEVAPPNPAPPPAPVPPMQSAPPYPGQPYPGQPYPGQPYPGQPYPAFYPPAPARPAGLIARLNAWSNTQVAIFLAVVILLVGGGVTAIALLTDESAAPGSDPAPALAATAASGIVLEVTGTGPADITYRVGSGRNVDAIHAVPFQVEVDAEPGETIYLSAVPTQQTLTAKCAIRVNGQVVVQQESTATSRAALCETAI